MHPLILEEIRFCTPNFRTKRAINLQFFVVPMKICARSSEILTRTLCTMHLTSNEKLNHNQKSNLTLNWLRKFMSENNTKKWRRQTQFLCTFGLSFSFFFVTFLSFTFLFLSPFFTFTLVFFFFIFFFFVFRLINNGQFRILGSTALAIVSFDIFCLFFSYIDTVSMKPFFTVITT